MSEAPTPTRSGGNKKPVSEKTKEAKPKKERTPRVTKFAPISVITVATPDQVNPKRVGTAAHERFKLYPTGEGASITVADALKAGVVNADLHWDWNHGFIAIDGETNPTPLERKTREKKAKKVEAEAKTEGEGDAAAA